MVYLDSEIKSAPRTRKATGFAFTLVCASMLALTGCKTTQNNPISTNANYGSMGPDASSGQTYNENELGYAISNHLGVTAESAASVLEKMFKDKGRPVGYITGEEGGGALGVGFRYGKGTLWMKDGSSRKVYWQGASIGPDAGGDASKVFTLVYGLDASEQIYRRYPGADANAYLVAGMAVKYQRANGITLAPVRTGIGLRLGANVGYTSYTKKRNYIPL